MFVEFIFVFLAICTSNQKDSQSNNDDKKSNRIKLLDYFYRYIHPKTPSLDILLWWKENVGSFYLSLQQH